MNTDPYGTPLAKKLGITDDSVFAIRRPPSDFAAMLGDTGGAVWQQSLLPPLDVVVAFHIQRKALLTEWPKLTAAVGPDGGIWIAWPKPTSERPTDITDASLRATLLRIGWEDTKACSIDDTWSALRFVQRKQTRRPKDRAKDIRAAKGR